MSTVALFSAKGAPGVTTTAMLIASLWPRPALLADCDPAGGDVGLRLPAPDGQPLELGTGLLSLLPLARRGLAPGVVLEHAQQVLGGGEVIVGVTGPEQAAAVGAVWTTLAQAFAGLDSHDVIIDAGRLDPTSPVLPLAAAAQVVACLLDASVSGVFAARARLRTLLPALLAQGGVGPKVGVIVRGSNQHDAQSAVSVIKSEFPDVTDLGFIATDHAGARIFDGNQVSRPERTVLARAGAQVIVHLESALYLTQWSPRDDEQLPAAATAAPADAAAVPRLSRAQEREKRKSDKFGPGLFGRKRDGAQR